MIVGLAGLGSDGSMIGAPTSTVTPAGAAVNVRSAADSDEKTTGLLKVTWMTLGALVTVAPLAGLVESTRSRSTALMALMALTRPYPAWMFQVPEAAPFIGVVEAIRPERIWAGVTVGTFCFISAATAAALGAADEVPKKLGRSCDRLVE